MFLYNSSKPNLTTLQYELMKILQHSNANSSGNGEIAIANSANSNVSMVTPTSIRATMTIGAVKYWFIILVTQLLIPLLDKEKI